MKIVVLLFLLLLSAPVWAQEGFVAGTEDIPLMEGLTPLPDLDMAFDTPEGRLVFSYAGTDEIVQKDIADFYAKNLPALGWTKKGTAFVRGKEQLILGFEKTDAGLVVRFDLKTM